MTRRINELGYEAIRQSPGQGARLIFISPNAQGNHSLIDEIYPNPQSLPGGGRDPQLAITVHSYDPWDFAGQEGKNAAWPGVAYFQKLVATLAAHSQKLGVPVHFGEFGVGRSGSQAERDADVVRSYYRSMSQAILAAGMAPAVWDDRGWFALVERDGTGPWHFAHGIVPAMVE